MIKAFTAIAAAAAIAAVITFSPGFAPEVEAGQTSTIAKTQLSKPEAPSTAPLKTEPSKTEPAITQTAAMDSNCTNQAWPHIDAACLRGTGNATVQPVRVITTDRR